VLTFAVDHFVAAQADGMLTARAVPYRRAARPGATALLTAYCVLIAALMLAMLGMAVFASFASFWPYNLTPSLRHYTMGLFDAEVGEGFVNSLRMAAGTAVFGTALVFVGAYLLEKTRGRGRCAAACAAGRCCRWPCPGWCWAWATSSSSTSRPTR
jgi:iron(III) transport system permease protein